MGRQASAKQRAAAAAATQGMPTAGMREHGGGDAKTITALREARCLDFT